MKRQMKQQRFGMRRLFGTGFAMGMADIVPGVSGGTIAFILGVYETLIESIKTTTGTALRLMLAGKVRQAVSAIPFGFLVPLGLGIVTAVLLLSKALLYLMQTHQSLLYGFFFGLVGASIWLVGGRVKRWTSVAWVAMGVTALSAYIIAGLVPATTPETAGFLFVSGMIAICAMILPGISGSYLLLIMGKYEQVFQAIHDRNLWVIGIFGLGAVVGLSLFSRLLSWLFARYHDITIAALTGFMLGSLRKLWPWKEVLATRVNSKGVEVPYVDQNVWPAAVDGGVWLVLLLVVAGFGLIILLSWWQTRVGRR